MVLYGVWTALASLATRRMHVKAQFSRYRRRSIGLPDLRKPDLKANKPLKNMNFIST
jgi:hypothetical protein